MYISGGLNVYPAEAEAVLLADPSVAEAAVFGVADARWGEVGWAVVVPRPGQQPDAEALLAACRAALATYKVPARIEVSTDPLPRTASGKVKKFLLRERHAPSAAAAGG
jgi:fatty-acyl-CoA synthase